jgi:hypothetical protein
LFDLELKVSSSSFTLLQKNKQIFTYISSEAAVIREIEKSVGAINSRMLQYHDATYLATHDQFYRKGLCGAQCLLACIMTVVLLLLLLLLRALFYLTNRPNFVTLCSPTPLLEWLQKVPNLSGHIK